MALRDGKRQSAAPRWLRPAVDAAMAVVYLLQMVPGKMGNPLHEAAGIAFALLFVVHHLLNRGWMRRLGRSRDLRARVTLASDALLVVCAAGTALTGVLMSRSAVPWLSVPALAHVVRPLHGCLAYLGFMTVALHAGLHLRVMRGYAGLRRTKSASASLRIVLAVASVALGGWAFVRLGVAGKLAFAPSFPDGVTPLLVQLALCLALAAPFVTVGSLVGSRSAHDDPRRASD